jgi:hypothetical protein
MAILQDYFTDFIINLKSSKWITGDKEMRFYSLL